MISWEGSTDLTPDFIRAVAGETENCLIQEIEVEQVLSTGRYQGLLLVLRRQLSNLKAYKVGRINMPVYVVGRSRKGSWLGVSTRVVAT